MLVRLLVTTHLKDVEEPNFTGDRQILWHKYTNNNMIHSFDLQALVQTSSVPPHMFGAGSNEVFLIRAGANWECGLIVWATQETTGH